MYSIAATKATAKGNCPMLLESVAQHIRAGAGGLVVTVVNERVAHGPARHAVAPSARYTIAMRAGLHQKHGTQT